MPVDMGVSILIPSGDILKHDQSKSKTGLMFTKLLKYVEEQVISQLAVFRCDLKR